MGSLPTFLLVAHLIGLVLGLGAANAKIVLLIRCRAKPDLLPSYLQVSKPITQLIVIGLIILALSGIGWLIIGYGFSTLMIIKLVLVAIMFVVGPIIDNVLEPRFRQLAPAAGQAPTPEFNQAAGRLFAVEIFATILFWTIFGIGVSL